MSIGLLRKIHQDLSIKDNNSGQFYFFILIFYINILKWYTFFKNNNIKIHYENQEGESSHFKNMSLDLLNGFSFSKERTLMSILGD